MSFGTYSFTSKTTICLFWEEYQRVSRKLYLLLKKSKKITDHALKYISVGMKHLKYLHLVGLKNITDVGLEHISKECKQIYNLSIRDCYYITNATLRCISEELKGISKIDFIGCNRITDVGFGYISKKCMNLRNLSCDEIQFSAHVFDSLHKLCKVNQWIFFFVILNE